ncbi:putative TIM-barrel fold metal-dependent hydrolase [Actinocorallia herbida]|uniref:Putative TIM-barrel fold metal-dependent hydrolase n=1 Tax=Actinocorallia herbida TaxID=58109 RepID=A0A3N1CV51_9ACTN|nr:amidohydrolase family protein [Actinocorallia herbida]ROO85172.1 putative TIM-barrel fold metal-dependent hydrolase [Actinocorallia herbida]
MIPAIDCLVNVDFGDRAQPDWMVRVKDDYFKAGDEMLASTSVNALLEEMDAQGVTRAILLTGLAEPSPRALSYVDAHPDRFSLGLGRLDLLRPMPTLRALDSFRRSHPVSYAQVGPAFWGDGQYPPSDAVYYPLYTKCCEWDLPLCLATGLPGPPIAGEAQHPMHLDRVCQRFPDLRLCMHHGADPWWDVAIRLMTKYRNLHLMTSAWSPRRLPASLLHHMRTRGTDRVIFASDSPVLSVTRCTTEARALDLPEDILSAYLHTNATTFFGLTP